MFYVIASGAAAWQSLALNKYSICTFLMPEIASELKFLAMTCSKLCFCERHTKNVIASGTQKMSLRAAQPRGNLLH